MREKLKVMSLNANGLRDNSKRINLFSWLKLFSFDIIFLQDVHYLETDKQLWSQQWGLPVVWSQYNAILTTNHSLTIAFHSIINHRLLLATITFNNIMDPWIVGSIYIPAKWDERQKFIFELPSNIDFDIVTLAGDCNLVANPFKDHSPPLNILPSQQWINFSTILQAWNLTDLHQSQSPSTESMTHWQNTRAGRVGTRIDYIFTNPPFLSTFSKIESIYCPYSDHNYISTIFTLPSTQPRGPGNWKMNISALSNEHFCNEVTSVWERYSSNNMNSRETIWSEAKGVFKNIAQRYCKNTNLKALKEVENLQKSITMLSRNVANSPCLSSLHQDLKGKLATQLQKKFDGERIRSRAKWVEGGEKSSKYFHKLIAAKRISSSITRIKKCDGSIVSSTADLCSEVHNFYKDLYSQGLVNENAQSKLVSYIHTKLSTLQIEKLEDPISLFEVKNAISFAPLNKTPGADGLPFEFYKAFAELLAPFLQNLFNQWFQEGNVSSSFKLVLISLIYKQKGDKELLKNWRPISLINCDIKLLTRILAFRLQNCISSIIHPSQTGFIRGRHIQDNCMMLYQILDHYREASDTGALIFLDQEKAYDRVDWCYLEKCLLAFGFGKNWITVIKGLYHCSFASVIVNNFECTRFPIMQGLRQGDPLSPLLYNIILEPFLSLLQKELIGVKLPGQYFKSSAFADDILVGMSTIDDQQMLFNAIKLHEDACNAKLNIEKCETLHLSGNLDSIGKLLTSNETFNYLGVPFHPKCHPFPTSYYNQLIETLTKTVSLWQKRKISLIGKVLVVNSRLLSKMWYLSYFVSFPTFFFKRLEQLISCFLWDGKRTQIALSTFYTSKIQGGMGLINAKLQVVAIKGWWVKAMQTRHNIDWLQLAFYNFINLYSPDNWSLDIIMTKTNALMLRRNGLWKDIYEAFLLLNGTSNQDIITFDEEHPFSQVHLLENLKLAEYSISKGRKYLSKKKYLSIQPKHWDSMDPPLNLQWDIIWRTWPTILKTLPPTQACLYWRVLLGNLMTGHRLKYIHPSANPYCCHCNLALETPSHLFWFCNSSSDFWKYIHSLISHFFPLLPSFQITLQSILSPSQIMSSSSLKIVITFIGFGLWTIWSLHWGFIFSNTPYNIQQLKSQFQLLFRKHLTSLYCTSSIKKLKFNTIWCSSPNISISPLGTLLINF
jgi:exonuclease III